MNVLMILGAVLLVLGVAVLVITQLLLHKWIKNYNREWMVDDNEMP
jgi:ABC-type phosphate transport system permease subunit